MFYRRNIDEEQRNLERRAATGDIHAEAGHLASRVRSGELHPFRVQLAALLGDPAALLLMPNPREGHVNLEPAFNYHNEEVSIGLNDVDIVIRNLSGTEFLVSIALGFLNHVLDRWGHYIHGWKEITVLQRAIHNWQAANRPLQILIDEVYDDTTDQSREDFYRLHGQRLTAAIDVETRAKDKVQRADNAASHLEGLGRSANQIRWCIVNTARAIWERGNLTNLHHSIMAAGEHARMATGSLANQQVELDWQRHYLIDRLLNRNIC